MNAPSIQALPSVSTAEVGDNRARRQPSRNTRRNRWYITGPIVAWKFFVGVLLCQSLLGAVIVVGWTQRLIKRAVLKSWWKSSPFRETGMSFHQFLESVPDLAAPRALPNWCFAEITEHPIQQNTPATGRVKKFFRLAFGSLWENLRQGGAGALNVFVWTLPATSLWLYAWVLGWNISFFKLYEQSHLGISLGLFGILLFILAMLYLPLAHVRQAVTGSWRSFYDLKLNWRLARQGAGRMLPLAICFAVAGFVVMLIRIAPYFLGSNPEYASLTAVQLREVLDNYFLAAAMFIFPAYVLVWYAAAKVYARAVLREYTSDRPDRIERTAGLHPTEIKALRLLQIEPRQSGTQSALVRTARWTTGKLATATMLAATCIVWFSVAVEVFVAQFFNYIPSAAWLNHPLVLLPWIRYIPPSLIP